jgi:hypothetical protein
MFLSTLSVIYDGLDLSLTFCTHIMRTVQAQSQTAVPQEKFREKILVKCKEELYARDILQEVL